MTSGLPVVAEVGHPLLGVTAGWELFARGDSLMVRIEPALGRITSTAIPSLASSGAVAFVLGQDRAIIRPMDFVPGYVVADGQVARELSGVLGRGGLVFPGPDPEHLWVQAGDGAHPPAVLLGLDGSPTGTSIPIPGDGWVMGSDGAGYLLFSGTGGMYDLTPGGVRRVTTGVVLAVGPTRLLAAECDDVHRCSTVVIDRTSGVRRVLGDTSVDYKTGLLGEISPDGRLAAVVRVDVTGATAVHLLDLASGADHPPAIPIDAQFDVGRLVWSPDSRWLFVAGMGGMLYVVDARTARIRDLGAPLPLIRQLAVRRAQR